MIETDRTVFVAVPVEALWEALSDVPAYPTFWPWLRRFDGLRLTLMAVEPGRRVVAAVQGDVWGAP